ncbi:RNAPII transcription regulator C-terminal-domain-containing protein [Morchella snyderi]|nr:RNAPII transcription regulator C-terminal-domain-containing protein [Morchella snyderi]
MDARLYMLNVEKDPTEATRIATQSAKRIESKELKLLDVVQSLGEYLVDDDRTVRAKAISYLSAVLSSLDSKALTRQHVAVIAQFLCDRLDDESGLKETSTGLIALQAMARFGKDEAVTVTEALCKVDLAKHPQGTRFVVLTLLNGLMERHRDALKSMGGKFVTGLVDLVGGEKDPRNLMIVFSVVKVVLVEFDIVMHVELLFDVVYCYFPITFRPPPDDPYGITAQDLKDRLRACISSTRYFAAQVFPQLIEKLDSTSPSVKKDVLQTIAACASSYGAPTIATHSVQLWDAVKFEILNSTDEDELAQEALNVAHAIAQTLSFGLNVVPPPTSPLARFLKGLVKECLKQLQEPQQKQAKPAGQILAKVATASAAAHAYVVQTTMPALLLIYSDAEGIAKQRALLEVLNLFLESSVKVYGSWGDMAVYPALDNPMGEFREKLFEMYSKALMGSSKEEAGFRITALRGLALLAKLRMFLEEGEIGMVVQYLDEVALEKGEKVELREEALRGLKDVSKLKPALIMSITFPAFMAQLPDYDDDEAGSGAYIGTLEALAKLSLERAVFEILLTRMVNKLEVILHGGCGPAYPRAILSTLLYVLQNMPERSNDDMKAHFTRLVPSLLTKTVLPLIGDEGSRVMADDSVLDVTGRLVNILVRALDVEQQTAIVEQVFNLFVRGKPCEYIPAASRERVAAEFRPFEESAPKEQSGCFVIFAYVLAAMRREIALPVDSLPTFLRSTVHQAAHPKSPAHRMSHLHTASLLTNKWLRSPDDTPPLQELTSTLLAPLLSAPPTAPYDELLGNNLRILFFIAKALVLRGDKHGMDITADLVTLLSHPTYGATASKGFAALLGDDDDFLTKANHAVMRLLTKQRIFAFCVPRIVEGFKAADSSLKPPHLTALSNILRSVTPPVILPSLPTLLPLLLQSLDLRDPSVKLATIDTLIVTVNESADAVKEHVASLVGRLLSACGDREANPPRVRAKALRCLAAFPGALRGELVLPYRRQVVKGLVGVLDDPKRGVRKEAVDCRAKWFAMDEPEV